MGRSERSLESEVLQYASSSVFEDVAPVVCSAASTASELVEVVAGALEGRRAAKPMTFPMAIARKR